MSILYLILLNHHALSYDHDNHYCRQPLRHNIRMYMLYILVREDNYYKLFTCSGPAPAFQHEMYSRELKKKAQTSKHSGIG